MSKGVLLGSVTDIAGETFEVFTHTEDMAFCPAGSVFIRSEHGGGPMLDPRARDQLRDMLDRAAAPREEADA